MGAGACGLAQKQAEHFQDLGLDGVHVKLISMAKRWCRRPGSRVQSISRLPQCIRPSRLLATMVLTPPPPPKKKKKISGVLRSCTFRLPGLGALRMLDRRFVASGPLWAIMCMLMPHHVCEDPIALESSLKAARKYDAEDEVGLFFMPPDGTFG